MPSGLWSNRVYRHLFAAQVVALLGTGLATVALALIAADLAGPAAGQVLGTALALKMVAYVGLAPFAAALAERLPRRGFLVTLDLIRAGVALCLPFVTEVWQVYALILVLQSASAAFTPAFQATIPEVLPDERDYTRALSLSRLAYDLESVASPVIAAALLTVITFHGLFMGTALGFMASAGLLLTVALPAARPAVAAGFLVRAWRGIDLYLAQPTLRGVLALNVGVAAAGAMVIVNTVVIVGGLPGTGAHDVAVALAAFGAGSMVMALALPRLLDRAADRTVMTMAALTLGVAMTVGAVAAHDLTMVGLCALWSVTGAAYAAVQTPVGRLLRAAAGPEDRPALFAAQFALSHAAWLVTYPLAGWVGAALGIGTAFAIMAVLSGMAAVAALRLWPTPRHAPHRHDDLPADHPHLAAYPRDPEGWHRHGAHLHPAHG